MITLSGYQINEILYESANSLVYRGQRQADGRPVVLKVLKDVYPSPERIAWFKREYEITRSLNPSALPLVAGQAPSASSTVALTGVAAAYELRSEDHRWLMALEDFGGESLVRLKLAGKLAVPDFLHLALAVAEILGQVHRRFVIHKDLNPSNIVFNPQSGQIKLIDFGISTQLSRENATFRNPNVLEGTLAYTSPEQTGRMNRAIDYRADFYSLGVTFYELLTGQLPFPVSDALELVHCHIARQPVPPHELKPDLPVTLSELVLKLMAKNAEDRYQSAYGLKVDLTECLRQWQANRCIEVFPIGQHDISDRFQIPQKLYGREREIETCLAAFAEVSQGASDMILVAGYPGIGKTALVQEIYKPITPLRGYFVSGKFDQLQRNIPYSALIQAFQSLIRHLLTESEADIAAWREKLLAALGPNGRVVVEVIPEVALIIGSQPEVPDLPPTEAQNRFNLVFQNFIQVFTQPEHPLVIFLDDLQWADGASLKLVQSLMTRGDSRYLFLIGAYRDNEVSAAHPLILALDELKQAGKVAQQISLSPLDLSHATQFIADACHCPPETARPLAELVLAKTGGNPFFVNEFLKSLYSEELLIFDLQQGGWQWDLTQIQAREMTDNVVKLLADKVQQLPAATQQVLELAACIGNQFDLQTLALVSEKPAHEVAVNLWPALAGGLILPLNEVYKLVNLEVEGLVEEVAVTYQFAHDRIQQAVYSLIPEANKQLTHRRVGKLLLQNTAPADREERIFDIIDQLNVGRGLSESQVERDELAQLNLLAGRKAKGSAAYESALKYLRVGIELLEDNWPRLYDLSLALHTEAAEMAGLVGDYELMHQSTDRVLQQASTVLDKAKAYEVLISAYFAQADYLGSMRTGREVLALLDVNLPEQPGWPNIMAAMQEIESILAGRSIESMVNLPEMVDPVKSATIRIMNSLANVAWNLDMNIRLLIICEQLKLLLLHGNSSESPVVYTNYGTVLSVTGNLESGYQFSSLAFELLERLKVPEFKAKTYFLSCYIVRHWKEPVRALLPYLVEAFQSGVETGDLEYAANAAAGYGQMAYIAGTNLIELDREMAKYNQAITQSKQRAVLQWQHVFWQAILNLLGRSEDPCSLSGDAWDEKTMLLDLFETKAYGALFILYGWKVRLCYRFQQFQQALENLAEVEKYMFVAEGSVMAPPVYLYASLARLAVFPESTPPEQEEILKKVAANQEKMKLWAEHAPMNYRHKYLLVEAERARVLGQDQAARDYYDQAIELAHENEYLNEESLAYELAGRFYLERGRTRLARYYLRDAHYAYQRWGALAKVKDLEARYPQFLTPARASRELPTLQTPTSDSGETAASLLDLNSVLKASQAISGEIVLDKLLASLMKIVVENAGAQRGYLLLEQEGAWVVEAEGTVAEGEVTAGQVNNLSYSSTVGQVVNLPHTIVNYVTRTREAVVLNDAGREGMFTQDPYVVRNQPKSILCAPLVNQGKLNGILYLENNLATGAFTPERQEILNLLSGQAAISIENARLYTRQVELTRSATRFVPQEFLQFLGKENIRQVNLGDQAQREVTIMVSDIRSFTTLSETMTPQENFDFVNGYLGRVSPIIRQHHGFIAKYMGDGMMAVFPRRAEDALKAAIAKLEEVARYNVERQQQGQVPLQIGIGIHVGPVMLGTVGEAQRMQFDLLSDAVNVSARLEGLSKLYGVALIISSEALMKLEDPTQYRLRFLGKSPVKGRQESLPVFEILDGNPAEVIDLKLQTKTSFEIALSLYYDWKFDQAKVMFQQALRVYPGDKAAQFYLKQMEQFMDYRAVVEGKNIDELMNR